MFNLRTAMPAMTTERTHWVYLLTNRSGALAVGTTTDLEGCLSQPRAPRATPSLTLAADRLVYAEPYATAAEAARRAGQIKGWHRAQRVALIHADNPTWQARRAA